MRALWYFQINLLWEKGTLVLEPQNADYIPKDASRTGNLGSDRKDLTFAMENLPEAWDATDLGRATKVLLKLCWARLICNNINMIGPKNSCNG